MAVHQARHQRQAQTNQNRPGGELHRLFNRHASRQLTQRQVTGDHRQKHRQLQQGVLHTRQTFVVHQDHRRKGNPGEDRDKHQPDSEGTKHHQPVFHQPAIVARQIGQGDGVTAVTSGFGHHTPQHHKGDQAAGGKQPEHAAPAANGEPGCTSKRTRQRSQQRHVGHQRHHAHRQRLIEGFLNCGIADRADKAEADALNKAQADKFLNRADPVHQHAGDGKKQDAEEHYRSPAKLIRERTQQPLQHHAANQVSGQGGGDPFRADGKFTGDDQHARLDHVMSNIGGKLEQH